MHDHPRQGAPARSPRRRPRLAALVAVLALALAVGGCGGGNKPEGVASLGDGKATSTTGAGGGSIQADLAYARCMRQHGIDMPDPKTDANGRTDWGEPPEGLNPDDPKFQAARQACRQYRENGGQAQRPSPQQEQEMVAFARCMRRHGINMPDPTPDGRLPESGHGLNPDDPKFKAAERACPEFRPKY